MNPCDELIPLAKRLDDGTAPVQRNLTVPEEKAIDAALFSGSKLVGVEFRNGAIRAAPVQPEPISDDR
jgi:hypothetical protein